jgi:uncharacterized protein YdhG (YjbR/CyaY superfamily)
MSTTKKSKGLTKWEIAAMKETIAERNSGKVKGEGVVLEKIEKMPEPDRTMAKRVHAIVMKTAPDLMPRLWYGMPAYSKKDKVVCWFTDANKFKARYSTFSFSDKANLDDGSMWPVVFALKKLTSTEEAKIAALVKKAVR